MKTKLLGFSVLITSLVLTLLFTGFVLAQEGTDSQPDGSAADISRQPAGQGDDSNPSGDPEVLIPARYQPAESSALGGGATAAVYFTPQDENTSTTVIFLYNTSSVTRTVGVQTFRLDGSTYINTNVLVPAGNLVRISADTVSTVSGTWQDVVLVNFTTSSTYGLLTLPEGVKAEGYVVWNDAGTYDPLQVAPTLSLRFSVDPPTVFLPLTQKN